MQVRHGVPEHEAVSADAIEGAFETAVRFWATQVDQQLAPRRVQPHSLTLCPGLFGGGQIHGDLAPIPFATVGALGPRVQLAAARR